MRSNKGGGHVWIALVLAVAAAILSTPRQGSAFEKLSSILLMIAESGVDETAAAIGDEPRPAVSPID